MFLFWLVFLLVILAYSLRTEEIKMPPSNVNPPAKEKPPPVMWDYERRAEYNGANIATYGNISLVDCEKICEKNTSCVAVSRPVNVDDYSGQCILKKELGNKWGGTYNTYHKRK